MKSFNDYLQEANKVDYTSSVGDCKFISNKSFEENIDYIEEKALSFFKEKFDKARSINDMIIMNGKLSKFKIAFEEYSSIAMKVTDEARIKKLDSGKLRSAFEALKKVIEQEK